MRKSILKSILVIAITCGGVLGIVASAAGTAKDGTTFKTNTSGNTVINHTGRDGSGGSIIEIDKGTGHKK